MALLARVLGLMTVLAVAAAATGSGAIAQAHVDPRVAVEGEWGWPVETPRRVLRAFAAPAAPWLPGHRGADIAASSGALLRAPADGVVAFAGWVVDRPVLSIDHGGGVRSSFEPVVAAVAAGEPVVRGQPIGAIEPGHCAAPCVHIGVRVDGEYRNPLLWLGGVPRSVLLPTRRLARALRRAGARAGTPP